MTERLFLHEHQTDCIFPYFKDLNSGALVLPSKLTNSDVTEGDVICEEQNGKTKQYYVVERIEPGYPPTAYVRHVTPAFWKSLTLALLLIAAWFGIDNLFHLFFFSRLS